MEYGLQLYSIRDEMEKDLAAALAQAGRIGYRYVEFAGFFGHTADEVCRAMEAAGVQCSGTHTKVEELLPGVIDETIAFHRAIGNTDIIIPSAKLQTLPQIEAFLEIVTFAQPKLAAAGIDLGFHNHSKEFATMYWGTTIHTELERRTDLHFEIDTYWAFNAGVDPLALCERLADRIHVIHVKDGMLGGRGMALGEGQAPVRAVVEMAKKHGWRMVVESETQDPTGPAEVTRCIKYLKQLEQE